MQLHSHKTLTTICEMVAIFEYKANFNSTRTEYRNKVEIHNVLQLEDDIVSIIKKQSCKHGLSIVCSALHHKIVLRDGVCKIESRCRYNNNIHTFTQNKGRSNHVHRRQCN